MLHYQVLQYEFRRQSVNSATHPVTKGAVSQFSYTSSEKGWRKYCPLRAHLAWHFPKGGGFDEMELQLDDDDEE